MRLGIDFGTTRTVVAYADRGNFPIVSFVSDGGESLDAFPSMVAERRGALRFGLDVLSVAHDPSWTLLRSFKRLLSSADASAARLVEVGSSKVPLLSLLTDFLRALRAALLERSNLPEAILADPAMRAVVAAPANALGAQRFLTLDAFRRAGFEVTAMLNEPSAAGFEYTHRWRSTLSARREHVVVYDLGGGTFDASLVRMSGTSHEALMTAGLPELGGDDFDEVLAKLALREAGIDRASLPAGARVVLAEECREAKERLGPNAKKILLDLDRVQRAAPAFGPDVPRQVTLETRAFYEACAPLVQATLDAMQPVVDRSADQLAGIYVVGGASSLPAVGRALRERFGRRVHTSPYPSAATAVGLAIASAGDAKLSLVDRFSRTFGVFREGGDGRAVTFDPIFTRETELPPAGEGPRVKERVYRAAHNLGHYRFIECHTLDPNGAPDGMITPAVDVLFPFDATLRGRDDLFGVDVMRLPGEGPLVRERYALDAHGLVELTITDVASGFERAFRVGVSAAAS